MKCPVCKRNIDDNSQQCPYCHSDIDGFSGIKRVAMPELLTSESAFEILSDNLVSKDKNLFAITGESGIGKTFLLYRVINSLQSNKFNFVMGKCTPLTQLSTGGVIQDMLLNLFTLPNYCSNTDDIYEQAHKFFSDEFKFLNSEEINRFINFVYPAKDGEYEDIIINKHKTFDLLNKIFEAICKTGKFIFVVDNMDFIDGFSIEFLTKFITKNYERKNLKFIALYNEHKPITAYFPTDVENADRLTLNIHLGAVSNAELENSVILANKAEIYISQREKDLILEKSDGNYAFAQQALNYCFDCQIADKTFLLTQDFEQLIKSRLETLEKINPDAYKVLSLASVIGYKFNLMILKKILGCNTQIFNDIVSYLVKSNFISKYNNIFYEFNNVKLWETILKTVKKDNRFEDINVKAGKVLSVFNINTNATMAMIAHNLKENRLAFDIWTKTSRLAAYTGDVNLYVVAQRQCLALLNEFNENETLKIRYNISERLGKLLTEYNPQEAMEYLPDAIANARNNNDEVKEIELLGFMARCCTKTSNHLGYIECADNILKKLNPNQVLQIALIKATKLAAIVNTGNYGEAVSLADNDILPILNNFINNPKLNNNIPLGYIHETKLRTMLYLSKALAFQGNDRSFEVLAELFENLEKYKNNDLDFLVKAKLVLAFANTVKGNFETSKEILSQINNIKNSTGDELENIDIDFETIINELNFNTAFNAILSREYEGLREELTQNAMYAHNCGNDFYKNICKVLLGKLICDSLQAKSALDIYDNLISYFAEKKNSFGAILTWYYISEATLIIERPQKALDIAMQALEIAQNPKINNLFLAVMLKILIARIYAETSDYQSANINLESALEISKKYSMNDLTCQIYFEYGKYYAELGRGNSAQKDKYISIGQKMYDKAFEIAEKYTKNTYLKDKIIVAKRILDSY